MNNTNTTITINGVKYAFRETFDVNLTLSYENENWSSYQIVREFLCNALDSVSLDINKVEISQVKNQVIIHDQGNGYPIVLAKRIGASSKKNDPSSIGQFGEGSKLALLTCIRKDIKVMLGSQDWLILPKSVEMEGQEVLMYDIYETTTPITGSIVILEATPEIITIINHLPDYFLHYSKDICLYGSTSCGIYPLSGGKAKLYNKGIYIRDIDGLFSYAISIEKLNRDRDLINHSDVAYKVRDLWESVDNTELIKVLIAASSLPSNQRNKLVEFYTTMYSNYPQAWVEAFCELYGQNACLFTDDIAEREASCLGYNVVRMEYNFVNILNNGGIKFDKEGLSDDFEFVFSTTLNKDEKITLFKLLTFAELSGFEVPERIKVFDEYKQHPDIPGLYNTEKQLIYLRRDLLNSNFEEALYVFLHEACHHSTQADDISREFADGLCRKLTTMLLKYTREIGIEETLNITTKGLELPESFSLSACEMTASMAVIGNDLNIRVGGTTIKADLPLAVGNPMIWNNRKVLIDKGRFVVSMPQMLKDILSIDTLSACIK